MKKGIAIKLALICRTVENVQATLKRCNNEIPHQIYDDRVCFSRIYLTITPLPAQIDVSKLALTKGLAWDKEFSASNTYIKFRAILW